jgi:hypothetical protein
MERQGWKMALMIVRMFLVIGETMESSLALKLEIKLELDGKKKGNTLRNLSILAQRNNLQKWKDSIIVYGQRGLLKQSFFI